jgi:NADH dehydrogenase FAD-containing subunit
LPQLAVVGGGPTGSEIAANLHELAHRCGARPQVTLVTPGERLIRQAPVGASRTLFRQLATRGIDIRRHTRIARREPGVLVSHDGRRMKADIVVLAIGLEANPLVYKMGLPTQPREGLRINAQLHSIADEWVFAAGDCAHIEGFDLPKLGVFGVKQARFIHGNILASLNGEALQAYKPQKRYLAILNLGDGTALSTWGPFWWNGHVSMWIKDRIDRRFLDGYRRASD